MKVCFRCFESLHSFCQESLGDGMERDRDHERLEGESMTNLAVFQKSVHSKSFSKLSITHIVHIWRIDL